MPAPQSVPRPGVDRRRLLGAVAGLPLLAGGLTGCGPDDGPARAVDGGPVQLSVFWWGAASRAEATERALRLYSARHPEVQFRVTWQGLTGYYDRLATQATGGNVPDLFQIDDTVLTEYARREIILDLSGHLADGRLDLRGLPEQLARYGQVDGRTMAVPAGQTYHALVYNRGLLRRLGLPEPRLGMPWPEYAQWAARLTRAAGNRVAGTTDPSGDYRALWLWLRGQGSELYRGRQLGFGSGDLLHWFEFWEAARRSRATLGTPLAELADSDELDHQLVVTGQAASSFAWAHQLPELQRRSDDELAITSFPGSPAAQWPRASMYWAAFQGTRHADVVIDVINFLTSDVEAGRILGTERGLPAGTPVRRSVVNALTDPGQKQLAALATDLDSVTGPAPAPPPRGHARVRALLLDAAESIRSKRSGARAATSRFMAQANAALAE